MLALPSEEEFRTVGTTAAVMTATCTWKNAAQTSATAATLTPEWAAGGNTALSRYSLLKSVDVLG